MEKVLKIMLDDANNFIRKQDIEIQVLKAGYIKCPFSLIDKMANDFKAYGEGSDSVLMNGSGQTLSDYMKSQEFVSKAGSKYIPDKESETKKALRKQYTVYYAPSAKYHSEEYAIKRSELFRKDSDLGRELANQYKEQTSKL